MSVNSQSHIYLIQDGKDIGTNVFKFGKSKQGIHDIIKLYLSIHAEAYENGFDASASLPIYFDSHW